jgi:F-type H+-transporting ATPase subunit epsilon
MKIDILTPEKKLFSGEIKSVKLPGTNGQFEILNNHAPIISTLSPGKIYLVQTDQNKQTFEINGGVIEMQKNNIIVLAE